MVTEMNARMRGQESIEKKFYKGERQWKMHILLFEVSDFLTCFVARNKGS